MRVVEFDVLRPDVTLNGVINVRKAAALAKSARPSLVVAQTVPSLTPFLAVVDLVLDKLSPLATVGRVNRQDWLLVRLIVIGGVIEKSVKLKIFFLRDRIVFVSMALSARHRRAHPDRHRRIDSIDHRGTAKFLVDGASFGVGQRVAMKGCCDQLLLGRMRKQISRQLLDGKLIKRFVFVKRPDDIIAKGPNGSGPILGVAHRVGIASMIQPHRRPPFAKCRFSQQAIHQAFIG